MKKLLTTTALITSIATSAFTGMEPSFQVGEVNFPVGNWYGASGDFAGDHAYGGYLETGCVFTGNERGRMNYDESTSTWNVDSGDEAIVQMEHRGVHQFVIESTGNIFRGGAETHATSTVDYTGSNATTISDDGDQMTNYDYIIGDMAVHEGSKWYVTLPESYCPWCVYQSELYIGGAAAMHNGNDDLLSGRSNYNIRHTITCMM